MQEATHLAAAEARTVGDLAEHEAHRYELASLVVETREEPLLALDVQEIILNNFILPPWMRLMVTTSVDARSTFTSTLSPTFAKSRFSPATWRR